MRDRPTNPASANRTAHQPGQAERRAPRAEADSPIGSTAHPKSQKVVENVQRPDDAARAARMPVVHVDRVVEAARHVRSYPSDLATVRDPLPQIQTPIQIAAGQRKRLLPDASADYLQARLPDTRWRCSTLATSAEPTAARNGARSRWVGSSAVTSSPTGGLHTPGDAHESQLTGSGD